MTYDEVIQLPRRSWTYNYGIYQDTAGDQKIYNADHRRQVIRNIRDPLNVKFKVGDIVLSSTLQEYGEIIEVNQDRNWGNHQYDVNFFNSINDNVYYGYQDETDLTNRSEK